MKYSYYPGCSLKGTGKAYEESVLAIFETMGVEANEIDDWNCCGATAYMGVDESMAFGLAGRNLALAEREGATDVVVPCNACYLSLNKANKYIEEYPQVKEKTDKALAAGGLKYGGSLKVRHPLDVFVNDIGLSRIKDAVKTPLKDLKVAPYYGCQIVRPYAAFDSQRNPTSMDQLLDVLGADVVDYPLKTRCCSGSQTGSLPEVGLRLVYILLKEAKRRGADVIVTICPLCQFNLESYQDEVSKRYKEDLAIPILYFTQVMGLALGLSAQKVGLTRNLVHVFPTLDKREVGHV
ncbi:MAG: CoB--CoM heterodisulfide reductase iron-sulfur subunit B family protein [Candidatus Omnitrophica bacterium]|nr:CoB--CoM heterodisulfide reductase iron-sulfur subunit B family protein [Candidatus Omnitrophota bacterium]